MEPACIDPGIDASLNIRSERVPDNQESVLSLLRNLCKAAIEELLLRFLISDRFGDEHAVHVPFDPGKAQAVPLGLFHSIGHHIQRIFRREIGKDFLRAIHQNRTFSQQPLIILLNKNGIAVSLKRFQQTPETKNQQLLPFHFSPFKRFPQRFVDARIETVFLIRRCKSMQRHRFAERLMFCSREVQQSSVYIQQQSCVF